MRRVTIQLVVTTLITVAFVLTALSGLVLYIPGQLLPVFGLSLLTWRAIHEWSALVLTAAVVAHIVLNRRRVAEMLVRLVQPTGAPQTAAAAMPHRSQDPEPSLGGAAAASELSSRLRLNRRWFLLLAASAVAAVIAGLDLAYKGSRSPGAGPASLLENFPVLNVRVAAAVGVEGDELPSGLRPRQAQQVGHTHSLPAEMVHSPALDAVEVANAPSVATAVYT